MESKIIDMLLEIKADVGDLKKGQAELKYSINSLDGRMCRVEDEIGEMKSEMSEMKSEMSEMRSDIGEIKITVNALSEGLLTTSREVKELKGQR